MEEYRLPKKAGFDVKYSKGKVLISTYYYIDRKISRYKYRYIEKNRELNPFTNVTFCYGNDQNEITVPAIVLVKSRGDVVLYDDFYKSNIDWKSLSEDKKRELYTEFVLHYLPKELGDAAVGNPITFIIMIIVGAVIAKAGAVIAACASLIGASFSVLNIIEGCKLISKSAEGYDSIYDVNATKVSAKDLARGIALLGIEVIPVLLGLIKRGIAKYNNKEIKIDEFVKREFGKNSKIRPKTNKSKTIKIENAAQMSVPQSEKAARREMAREQPLPDYERLSEINVEKTDHKEIKLSRNDPIVQKIAKETSSEILNELTAKNSIKTKMTAKIKEIGWTEKVFAEKAVTPISKLSDDDLLKIRKINEVIPNPTNDTLMSKVISEETYKMYISNGIRSGTVAGCVTKAIDVANYKTYNELYEKLGLHYDGSPYKTADKMYIMKFTSVDTENNVCRNLGGTTKPERKRIMDLYGLDENHAFIQKDPFVGNGMTKTPFNEYGTIEYQVSKPCDIDIGAVIYELDRNGSIKIVAVRVKDKSEVIWKEIK